MKETIPNHQSPISLIIPVHNRKTYTQSLLTQIQDQMDQTASQDKISVIVIDDGSTDGTKELISNSFPAVHLLEGDGSLWWTGAIVKGMEYALKELNTAYFVWLNNDISLSKDFVNNLLSICSSPEYKETVIGGIVRDKTYSDWIVYSGIRQGKPVRHLKCFSSSPELEVETVAGNIAVIPRVIIEKVGMPDTQKFPHNGGDYEFIKNVKAKGFRVISSAKLQATTEFTVDDLVRYMPYQMQWHLQPSFSQRWKIITGLKTLKANQNIWLFVNIQNRDQKKIPWWKYSLCYLDKIMKLFVTNWLPKRNIDEKIEQYFSDWSVPKEIAALALKQRKPT